AEHGLRGQSASIGQRFRRGCYGLKPVLLVDKNNFRIPVFGLFLVHRYEGCDDDLISRLYFSCGCTVKGDDSGPLLCGEGVCGEPVTGGDAPDVYFLEGKNSSRFHQRRVYLDASLIVQVSTCDSGSVNLALEHSHLQSCRFPFPSCLEPCYSLDLNRGYCLSRELGRHRIYLSRSCQSVLLYVIINRDLRRFFLSACKKINSCVSGSTRAFSPCPLSPSREPS